MNTDTRQRIFHFIKNNDLVTPHQLTKHFDLSPQMIHRHLRTLEDQGSIRRVGWAPKTFYEKRSTARIPPPPLYDR